MPNLLNRANTTAIVTTFLNPFRPPLHAKGQVSMQKSIH